MERGSEDSIGEPKEGDLSKHETRTVNDESTGKYDSIHENEVNLDDGEPTGVPLGAISGKGIG